MMKSRNFLNKNKQLYLISIIAMSVFIGNNPYVIDYNFNIVLKFIIGSVIILGLAHLFYYKLFILDFEKKETISKGVLYSSIFGVIALLIITILSYFNHEYTLNHDLSNYNSKLGLYWLLIIIINIMCIAIAAIVDIKFSNTKRRLSIILRSIGFYSINYVLSWIVSFFIMIGVFGFA